MQDAHPTATAASQGEVEAQPLLAPLATRSQLAASTRVSPHAISALILRCRAFLDALLPVEVAESRITDAEGVLTVHVIDAALELGGDYAEAVPYALIEARRTFLKDAERHEAQLNELRALACEELATRLVIKLERLHLQQRHAQHSALAAGPAVGPPSASNPARLAGTDPAYISICKRYRRVDDDGDVTLPCSALEAAVDQDLVRFLASKPARACADAIWKGELVQRFDDADKRVAFFELHAKRRGVSHHHRRRPFWSYVDPARLAVPRYAYWTSLMLHVAFLSVYTLATLEYSGLDAPEIILWIFAAGYLLEDVSRWIKIRGFDSLSFWLLVDLLMDVLFLAAFSLRVSGWLALRSSAPDAEELAAHYQLLAFRTLACIAPVLWVQLLKLLDGFRYFGVITIMLLRMLKEAAAFFVLLALTAIGTAQAFFALDAADGHVSGTFGDIVNLLAQGILGQADFERTSEGYGQPYGLILYYAYTFVQITLLANILVAFFSSSYDATVEDADSLYAAYHARKVVTATRAPDEYVYPSPLNLVEALLVAPFERLVASEAYRRYNRVVQTVVFAVPLGIIAAYESGVDARLASALHLEMLDRQREEEEEAASAALQQQQQQGAGCSTASAPRATAVALGHVARSDALKLRRLGVGGSTRDPVLPRERADAGMELARVGFERLCSTLPRLRPDLDGEASMPASRLDVRTLLEELRDVRRELLELRQATTAGGATAPAATDVKKEEKEDGAGHAE